MCLRTNENNGVFNQLLDRQTCEQRTKNRAAFVYYQL